MCGTEDAEPDKHLHYYASDHPPAYHRLRGVILTDSVPVGRA
jgi:hypothetical protein